MKLISWNMQYARGVDGEIQLSRIIDDTKKLGDFDVLCLQEVANNFPLITGQKSCNQFEEIAQALPDYTVIPHVAVDIYENGIERTFGNMILTRYPILRVMRHQLPWVADSTVISMPRVLTEVTLDTPSGLIRVMNTHLEFHSWNQRLAQIQHIRQAHDNSCQRAQYRFNDPMHGSTYCDTPQTTKAILVGDFNMPVEDKLYQTIQAPFTNTNTPRLLDAWTHLHPDTPHPFSVGIYDHEQWPHPFTCDFMFVSEDLLPQVSTFDTDIQTQASDHQPILIEIQ